MMLLFSLEINFSLQLLNQWKGRATRDYLGFKIPWPMALFGNTPFHFLAARKG
jgi:hypothetical protein